MNQTRRFLLLIVCATVFIYLGRLFSFDQVAFQNYFQSIPLVLSGCVFLLLYVGLTFFIWVGPKDVLRIVAAVVYGPYLSTFVVWMGEAANTLLLFTLSRRLGRDYVSGRLKGRMRDLDERIADSGFWSIFFLKITPIVPFRFLDLGFGLTRISLKKYWLISLIASPLRIFFLQFFLAVGLDTVLNPTKLQTYLEANPFIMQVTSGYLLVSLVFMFVLKGKGKSAGIVKGEE